MLRRTAILIAASIAAVFSTIAVAQPAFVPPPNPTIPADARIFLYPITRFRGTPTVLTASNPKVTPASIESIATIRGVWDLCSENYYYGKCVRVSSTMMDIPIAIIVRSAHLVGDAGPTDTETPQARIGPDIIIQHNGDQLVQSRPAPAPVVAPRVEEGGKAGTNPSLAGVPAAAPESGGATSQTKFFPAPAQNGLRVLACAGQASGSPAARCVQAAADGFCVSQGFKESAYRETEMSDGKAFLANVLCKTTPDDSKSAPAAQPKGGEFKIPFLKK